MFFKVLITVAAAATLAMAQGDMGGVGSMGSSAGRANDAGGGGMGGGARPQKESKADQIANKLKLNKDQKTEFESILEASFQEAAPVRTQLSQARAAVAGAFIDGKTTDDMLKAYAGVYAQMTAVEVKAFQKIYAMLKPNQTTKAGEAFDLMGGLFDIQPGRGRGAGMGRGRGGQ